MKQKKEKIKDFFLQEFYALKSHFRKQKEELEVKSSWIFFLQYMLNIAVGSWIVFIIMKKVFISVQFVPYIKIPFIVILTSTMVYIMRRLRIRSRSIMLAWSQNKSFIQKLLMVLIARAMSMFIVFICSYGILSSIMEITLIQFTVVFFVVFVVLDITLLIGLILLSIALGTIWIISSLGDLFTRIMGKIS